MLECVRVVKSRSSPQLQPEFKAFHVSVKIFFFLIFFGVGFDGEKSVLFSNYY